MIAHCPIMQFPFIDLNNNKSEVDAMLIQTIQGNCEGYMWEEVE